MLEKKHEKLLPAGKFFWRVVRFATFAGVILLVALGIGVAGYHWFAGFSLIDSLLNASMILTGMGPVGELPDTRAKLFASAYALFSGIIFISAASVFIAPLAHRILHMMHIEDSDRDS